MLFGVNFHKKDNKKFCRQPKAIFVGYTRKQKTTPF